MIRRVLRALVYREISQAEALEALQPLITTVRPRPTRPGYDVADGRERMAGRFTRWQQAADRILRKHGKRSA